MSVHTRTVNAQLKKLMLDNARDFAQSCDRSRQEYLKKLGPGEPIPAEGRFYDKDSREEYRQRSLKRQQEAREILDREISALSASTMDAPDPAAVSVLQVMAMRDKLTRDEIDNFVSMYGDNYQAYRTVQSLAKKQNIYLADNPIDAQIEDLNALSRNLNDSLSLSAAEGGHATDGFISFMNIDIDSAFATE